MLSSIILGGITLPKFTSFPKLEYEPVILYSKPSVTGRLHNVYRRITVKQFGYIVDSVKFNRVFKFEIIGIDETTYNSLKTIDGTNCLLEFYRDTYTEKFMGNLDMTFFKFDDHIYFDSVKIEFTVTEEVYIQSIMYFAHAITNAIVSNNNLMFVGSNKLEITDIVYDQHGEPEFPGDLVVSLTVTNIDPTDTTYPTAIRLFFEEDSVEVNMNLLSGTFPDFVYTVLDTTYPAGGNHTCHIVESTPDYYGKSNSFLWTGGWVEI